jgi:beta-lactamase superfamily II metal-dependent hydrolase
MPRLRIAALLALSLAAACAEHAPLTAPPVGPRSTVSPSAGTVLVNEVMADPSAVTDANGEWIEVYNRGATSINLQGWKIASNNDVTHTIASSVNVPAGGYVVLGRVATGNGGVTLAYVYGTAITLANTADWVALRDGNGATVDSVSWSAAPPAGASRGVKDASADNTAMGGTNWATQTSTFGSGDGGTPGAANDGAVAAAVATVTVSPASASLTVGGAQQFAATAKDAGGNVVATSFTWTSSATGVATVDATGRATAVAAGSATITARSASGVAGTASLAVTASTGQALTVQVLDVGQGDANLILNGTSRIIVDGGPDSVRFGKLLDSLSLNNTTIDAVILSHEHFDHHSGLRELFRSSRNITVRYFFENKNAYTNAALSQLRDSINARVARGQLVYRDTDDPCGTGAPICDIAMNGGAHVHVLRPNPAGTSPNDRSAAVKVVGPDSASFTMWMAGDAEQEEINWFLTGARYDLSPGMRVDVLKADHHGSCNGVTNAYVQATNPGWVTASVGATNSYGHMHTQAKDVYTSWVKPWYRTDLNGTITIRTPGTPGGGYTITPQRAGSSLNGSPDRASTQTQCNPVP